MDLGEAWSFRYERWDHRDLESPRRGDHVTGFDDILRCLDTKPRTTIKTRNLFYLDTGTDRGLYPVGVIDEVIGDTLFCDKIIGTVVLEFQSREAIMPGRTVGHQRIPSFRAPAFCDTISLQHDMANAIGTQMFACGDTGLSCTNDKHFCSFDILHRFQPLLVLGTLDQRC